MRADKYPNGFDADRLKLWIYCSGIEIDISRNGKTKMPNNKLE